MRVAPALCFDCLRRSEHMAPALFLTAALFLDYFLGFEGRLEQMAPVLMFECFLGFEGRRFEQMASAFFLLGGTGKSVIFEEGSRRLLDPKSLKTQQSERMFQEFVEIGPK